MQRITTFAASTVVIAAAIFSSGCTSSRMSSVPASQPVFVETTHPAAGQSTFADPDAAVKALLAAAKAHDMTQMGHLFGPAQYNDLLSGDHVQDENSMNNLATHITESTRIEQPSPGHAVVYVGRNDWPLPIPLMTDAATGQWFFDTPAGATAILARRVGHNELSVISLCNAYIQAQHAYASADRDGDGVLEYAQRMTSTAGTHDGLYWPAAEDSADQSPLGPLAAQAASEGYAKHDRHAAALTQEPFHGYYFRILTKQGAAAPGGAYSYVINGNMIAGFGLVAWPAKYGSSGVMTFIVNHQGKVYQKDLGPNTPDRAGEIESYNPDSSWNPVAD
ncbi:MAG TPA: DUF2950 domain-containing protein [Tepidisphaeraceae bacterium]|jgi:hypothetical protein|nr:DUF2950 domain-containing protein [Tepidisphaeraceae bacterium]